MSGFNRYSNTGSPGGDPDLKIPIPRARLLFAGATEKQRKELEVDIREKSQNILKTICDVSGISSIMITSTRRKPEDQARIMFNNLEHGKTRNVYKTPGQNVIRTYDYWKKDRGYSFNEVISQTTEKGRADSAFIKNKMATQEPTKLSDGTIMAGVASDGRGGSTVSGHCASSEIKDVIDLDPKSIKWTTIKGTTIKGNESTFRYALIQAAKLGWIRKFIYTPPLFIKDPAIHIDIPVENTFGEVGANDALPSVRFFITNTNLQNGKNAWFACFQDDLNRSRGGGNTE